MGIRVRQITDRASSATRWREHVLSPGRPWGFLVEIARGAKAHRTTGHAAEMAFFAVLTLVPSTIAVGSAFGLSKRVFGAERRAAPRRPPRPRCTR